MARPMGKAVRGTKGYVLFTGEHLGRGSMGNVCIARHRKQGTRYAAKLFTAEARTSHAAYIKRELDILQLIPKHDNVINLIAIETDKHSQDEVVIMELCEGGSLQQILDQPQNYYGLPESEFMLVLKHISDALYHLYKHKIVHRDVKPGNILLSVSPDGRHIYKLTDFGASRSISADGENFKTMCGTEEYLHPKMHTKAFVRNKPSNLFGAEVDMWSFAVTLYQCATGQLPYRPRRGIREDRKVMSRLMEEKAPGVISNVELPDGKFKSFKTLPSTTPLSCVTRHKVTEILAGLMNVSENTQVGGSSVAGNPQVEGSSVAGNPQVEGSSVAGKPYVGGSSVAESPHVGGSSVAGNPHAGGSSVAEDPDVSVWSPGQFFHYVSEFFKKISITVFCVDICDDVVIRVNAHDTYRELLRQVTEELKQLQVSVSHPMFLISDGFTVRQSNVMADYVAAMENRDQIYLFIGGSLQKPDLSIPELPVESEVMNLKSDAVWCRTVYGNILYDMDLIRRCKDKQHQLVNAYRALSSFHDEYVRGSLDRWQYLRQIQKTLVYRYQGIDAHFTQYHPQHALDRHMNHIMEQVVTAESFCHDHLVKRCDYLLKPAKVIHKGPTECERRRCEERAEVNTKEALPLFDALLADKLNHEPSHNDMEIHRYNRKQLTKIHDQQLRLVNKCAKETNTVIYTRVISSITNVMEHLSALQQLETELTQLDQTQQECDSAISELLTMETSVQRRQTYKHPDHAVGESGTAKPTTSQQSHLPQYDKTDKPRSPREQREDGSRSQMPSGSHNTENARTRHPDSSSSRVATKLTRENDGQPRVAVRTGEGRTRADGQVRDKMPVDELVPSRVIPVKQKSDASRSGASAGATSTTHRSTSSRDQTSSTQANHRSISSKDHASLIDKPTLPGVISGGIALQRDSELPSLIGRGCQEHPYNRPESQNLTVESSRVDGAGGLAKSRSSPHHMESMGGASLSQPRRPRNASESGVDNLPYGVPPEDSRESYHLHRSTSPAIGQEQPDEAQTHTTLEVYHPTDGTT